MAVFAFESEHLAACTVDVGLRIKLFPGRDTGVCGQNKK